MTSTRQVSTIVGGGTIAVLIAGMGTAGAQVGAAAAPNDPIRALNQRLAALEVRVQTLEAGQAAFKKALSQPDVPDDAPQSTQKLQSASTAGKSSPRNDSSTADSTSSAPLTNVSPSGGSLNTGTSGGGPAVPATKGSLARVKAPFVVVDGKGQVLFRVQDPAAANGDGGGDRGIYVYDESGRASASLTASQGGGKLKVTKTSSNTYVTAAATDQGVGLMVREDGNPRAFAGVGAKGAGRVYIYAGGGENPKAGLTTFDSDNKGLVAAFSGNTAVAMLSESQKHPGGGQLTVTDPNGDGVFSAAYDGDEGAACLGHKEKLHCLGPKLP